MTEWILQILTKVFIEFLINTVCYYFGWPICRILTLGSYPKEYPHEEGLVTGYMFENYVSLTGFIIILVSVGFLIID